jgi:hypothetical protein
MKDNSQSVIDKYDYSNKESPKSNKNSSKTLSSRKLEKYLIESEKRNRSEERSSSNKKRNKSEEKNHF